MTYLNTGLPEAKKQLSVAVQPYFLIRHELSVHEGIVFRVRVRVRVRVRARARVRARTYVRTYVRTYYTFCISGAEQLSGIYLGPHEGVVALIFF